jgi:Leucine Rich repeat
MQELMMLSHCIAQLSKVHVLTMGPDHRQETCRSDLQADMLQFHHTQQVDPSDVLANMPALRTLATSDIYSCGEGARHLTRNLPGMSALRILHVRYIPMQAHAVEALVQQCRTLAALSELQLSSNDIDCKATKALKALQALSLKGNNIRTPGAMDLAVHLSHMPALQCLILQGNPIQATGLCTVVKSVSKASCLRVLDVFWSVDDDDDAGDGFRFDFDDSSHEYHSYSSDEYDLDYDPDYDDY